MPDQPKSFDIIPDDKEFVERIAGLIPLEHADRESLATLIAGHRIMHRAASPAGELERELVLLNRKYLYAMRCVHNLVTQLGGKATVKDADIPFDWNMEMDPSADAQSITFIANRCPPPTGNEQAPAAGE
jgi:hypothetical protein